MPYQEVSGILAFISIMFLICAVIIRREKRKKLLESFILREKSNEMENIVDTLARLLGPLMPEKSKLEEIRHYLNELDYKNINPERLYVYTIGVGLILGVLYFLVLSMINFYLAIIGIFLGIITGYYLPLIYLKSKFENIQNEKQMGILPYVEMLQVACEAGLTLTLAVERVHEYYPSPISLEFKKANNDFMANISSRRESLQNIIDRVGGEEIHVLIEALIQSIDIGTPMKTALKTLADSIRRELRKRIIDKGQQAKWKNFVVSICFQFPPYIFIIAGPALASLMGAL